MGGLVVWRSLHERHLAQTYYSALVRSKDFGVTADVMARSSQLSCGFWDATQDALADLVRIITNCCCDVGGAYPELHQHSQSLSGQATVCGFPNLFITIAPAEWKVYRPHLLEPYVNCMFAGA